MTIPRNEQIDINATPFYHVMNRCVRQSFLCGFDKVTQKDYSYRKSLILSRIKSLSNIFAIDICAFAIMSNHFHLILHVDDHKAQNWSETEVFERWKAVCPNNAKQFEHDKIKLKLWRSRLSSISWFMKLLNERIARAINKEDGVKGHFWESRFKSQALLDMNAVLSAMVYVDLNPIRSGIAQTPESSDFTSIQERINSIVKGNQKARNPRPQKRAKQPDSLMPFIEKRNKLCKKIAFELKDYIELVDATGRAIRNDKKAGSIPSSLPPILSRLSIEPSMWLDMVRNITSKFSFAIGSEVILANFRKRKIKSQRKLRFSVLAHRQAL